MVGVSISADLSKGLMKERRQSRTVNLSENFLQRTVRTHTEADSLFIIPEH